MKLGRQMYLWLGLVVAPLAIGGLRLFTRLTNTPRVRVLVIDERGKILLIKNVITWRDGWTLPGGGVSKNESYLQAAQRELREETGIIAPLESFYQIAVLEKKESKLRYEAPLVEVQAVSLNLPATPYNMREIAEVGWFDPKELPLGTARLVSIALAKSSLLHKGE